MAAPYLLTDRVPQVADFPTPEQLILTDIDIGGNMGSVNETISLPVACCAPLAQPTMDQDQAVAAAEIFKALSDPHRVLILNRLLACGEPVCVCELNDELDLAQPTVSFHLKKMVNAGLLIREKRGTWAYYSVAPQAVDALSELFKQKESVA